MIRASVGDQCLELVPVGARSIAQDEAGGTCLEPVICLTCEACAAHCEDGPSCDRHPDGPADLEATGRYCLACSDVPARPGSLVCRRCACRERHPAHAAWVARTLAKLNAEWTTPPPEDDA